MNQYLSTVIQEQLEQLMHNKRFLSVLYILAGKRCLKLEGFRMVSITILNGQDIMISTPYFYNRSKGIKTAKKKCRRSKGNNIDCHLGLSYIGMISRFSGNLASEICKMALLCPSIEMAAKLMSDRGVKTNCKTLRKVVRDVGLIGLSNRGCISISNKENIKGKTLVIGTDGGRIRERNDKNKKGAKYKGYTTDWKEPVLFTMYLSDEKGEVDKDFIPLYDATMQGKNYTFTLLEKHLGSLDCENLSRIVFVGDGAPWIWSRAEKLFKDNFQNIPTYQVLDYTHAKQALNEILNWLPKKCKEHEKLSILFKKRLWEGDIDGIEKMIRINFTGQGRKKALNKWGNYFLKNKDRMQYSKFKNLGLPKGSGTVESAIRRVINLRLKSCGSFWKKENAEIYLFLRAQIISGRWNIFFENVLNRLESNDNQINIKSNDYLKWAA